MTDRERAYLAAIARAYQLAPDDLDGPSEESVLERVWCDVCLRLQVPENEQEAIMDQASEQLRREGFFT